MKARSVSAQCAVGYAAVPAVIPSAASNCLDQVAAVAAI